MMAQCTSAINYVQENSLFSNNYCFNGVYSKPKLLIHYNTSFSFYGGNGGKCAGFQKNRSFFSSSLLGYSNLLIDVEGSSCKAKVHDKGEAFPPIQTLRRFPKEELSSKVVMVRFDSSIIFHRVLDYPVSIIISNAFFTIKYLYEVGAKVVLTSSWNVKCDGKILSVEDIADFLSSTLQLKVVPCKCLSTYQQMKMEQFDHANIILLENLYYYKQELGNHSEFARTLASRVDIFVNDSFSTAHKILASIVGVTQFCYACLAGFYFEECLVKLKKLLEFDAGPIYAVVGGGNIKDKEVALRVLASKCDGLVFVGIMAIQIMHALRMPVPLYLVEREGAKVALEIVKYAQSRSIPILLPRDFLCKNNQLQLQVKTFPAQSILDGWEPVDLGPDSFIEIATFLSRCKKIIWIGPVKVKQSDHNSDGASKLARILDELSQNGSQTTIVGHTACDAVLKISRSPLSHSMVEHASIVWEYLKGRKLPGLLALDRAYPYAIEWNMIYTSPIKSLVVDIGSGNGLFLMGMAKMRNDLNFLGLEINEKLVTRCLQHANKSGPKNLHFIATNATSSFRSIVSSYPGPVILVSIQCPNPDFNEPEHRWRMVQRSLIEAIVDELAIGGKVFLQSDIEKVAIRMRNQFLTHGKKKLDIVYDDENIIPGWLKENPFGVHSDWERHVLARGDPMYRLMLFKRDR